MKALLTILILTALASAQAWGPAGVPLDWRGLGLTWMESEKFTSAGATNYLSMTSSAAADSLVWTQTGTPGDRDMVIKLVDDTGVSARITFDDGTDNIELSKGLRLGGSLLGSSARWRVDDVASTSVTFSTATADYDLILDPNSSGFGTTIIGETGDNDLCHMNSLMYTTTKTIADGDATPSVAGGNVFVTSANTAATEITDLDDPVAGQPVTIIGGSDTNSSTIADGGNFNLSGAWTASEDDVLILYVLADNNYIELGRVNN